MPRVKKIPMRLCVGCQEQKPKRELIRIVRTPEDAVEIDPTGKRSGRGVYICPSIECLQKAVKTKRLEKSLKKPIASEVIESLKQGLAKHE